MVKEVKTGHTHRQTVCKINILQTKVQQDMFLMLFSFVYRLEGRIVVVVEKLSFGSFVGNRGKFSALNLPCMLRAGVPFPGASPPLLGDRSDSFRWIQDPCSRFPWSYGRSRGCLS